MSAKTQRAHERRVPEDEWRWFGNAGHLIVGHDCRFHLCTLVGEWLVSTVGEWWPSRASREIHAGVHDPAWLAANRALKDDNFDAAFMKRFGCEEIGCERTFETMVFRAGKPCDRPDCGCGIPAITGAELDVLPYKDRANATKGHMKLCRKWARRTACA